jgi:uncharacterized protein YjbI with pentapeptide repeats
MANEEQLSILKQGVEVWNKWRDKNRDVVIDLNGANLRNANLSEANLTEANLCRAILIRADLSGAYLSQADLSGAFLIRANLSKASLYGADLDGANLSGADLVEAILNGVYLESADLIMSNFSYTHLQGALFRNLDLSEVVGLDDVVHEGPSTIGTNTIAKSKGKIPEVFLQGCGLSDVEIEFAKLSNPDLNNEEINKILYKMYDLRATQALQISPLFISYSHGDDAFVDKIGKSLTEKGVRHWRDIHEMKAGRLENQIDRAIRQNPTVVLILSEHSLSSDWVEHEVRMARELEKDIGRDVLCPVALDDSWKNSPWPKRVMEQIMEYNILDFSAWKDDGKFESTFKKLIDGLKLFYKG